MLASNMLTAHTRGPQFNSPDHMEESLTCECVPIILTLGRQTQGDLRSSMVSQPSPTGNFQIPVREEVLKKPKWTAPENNAQSCPLTFTCTWTCTLIYTNPPPIHDSEEENTRSAPLSGRQGLSLSILSVLPTPAVVCRKPASLKHSARVLPFLLTLPQSSPEAASLSRDEGS